MDDDQDYGPAMSALNDRQRAFVMAMIEFPGITQAKAAEIAGYRNSPGGMKVQGHSCAHNAGVQAAIREVAGARLNSNSLLAADVLVEIARDEGASRKDRLKAAGMLLDRTGFAAEQTINVNKTVTDRTGAGMLDRIKALASGLGIDSTKLLGGNVVEGEFSEVKE
jgi:phage terminase small subunit